MKRIVSILLMLCLFCATPAIAEGEDIEAPPEESVVVLGEDEPAPTEAPPVSDEKVKRWSSKDCVIPYPDVTSAEIRELLSPSDRVYPGLLVWPLPGTPVLKHITSHVGWRNAGRIHSRQGGDWPSWLHHGIDVGHVTKKQPVAAAATGVAYAGWKRGDGNYVVIDHGDGWYTEYQHLSAFAGNVASGTRAVPVEAGEVIGYVGNSGGDYPVHFHFEIVWSPDGAGSDDIEYFRQTKNRTIRAYSFPQDAVVKLHWAKTWEICTAEKQHFVESAEALDDDNNQ